LTIEKLKGTHSSYPRNTNIAGVFFKAGYIESWGRGTNKIINACVEAGLPEPIIEEDQKGIRITFLKDIYTEGFLRSLDLNERQVKIIQYLKEHRQITNGGYQKIIGVSRRTALRDLQELLEKQVVIRVGAGGSDAAYLLKNAPNAP